MDIKPIVHDFREVKSVSFSLRNGIIGFSTHVETDRLWALLSLGVHSS